MGTPYAPRRTRLFWSAAVVVGAAYGASLVALLIWFWSQLAVEGMTVPVPLYIAVLGAMVCAVLCPDLPTAWTALGRSVSRGPTA